MINGAVLKRQSKSVLSRAAPSGKLIKHCAAYLPYVFISETVEYNYLVYAVKQLGAEGILKRALYSGGFFIALRAYAADG